MTKDYELGCNSCGFLLTILSYVNGRWLCPLCAKVERETGQRATDGHDDEIAEAKGA